MAPTTKAASSSSHQASPERSPKAKTSPAAASFYSILGVEKCATAAQIKQAYYKLALKYHPDRCAPEQQQNYSARFKDISFAYEVLSDADKRQVYDRNPSAFSDGNTDISRFTQMFTKISTEDIEAFKAQYIGSAEELEDIMAAYLKYYGDMAKISESVFFGSVYEEARYREIIERQIAKGILPEYKNPESEKRKAQRIKRAQREAREASEYAKELGLNTGSGRSDFEEGSLVSLIQNRHKSRFDDMISGLEAKYCKGSSAAAAKGSPSLKRVRSVESFEVSEKGPSNNSSNKRVKSNFPAKK